MGSVRQGARIALVSLMIGGMVTACGTAAPTQQLSTKQVTPLAVYPLADGVDPYTGSLAAASSILAPWSTNIVGTSPWLGFPTPAMAAGLLPFPTFAPNIGTAAVLNGQAGYLLGSTAVAGVPGAYGGGVLGYGWPGGMLGAPGIGGLWGPGAGVSSVMGFPWLTAPVGPIAGGAIGAASAAAVAGVAAGGIGSAVPGVGMGQPMQGMMPGMQQGQAPGMQQGQMPEQQQQPAQQDEHKDDQKQADQQK